MNCAWHPLSHCLCMTSSLLQALMPCRTWSRSYSLEQSSLKATWLLSASAISCWRRACAWPDCSRDMGDGVACTGGTWWQLKKLSVVLVDEMKIKVNKAIEVNNTNKTSKCTSKCSNTNHWGQHICTPYTVCEYMSHFTNTVDGLQARVSIIPVVWWERWGSVMGWGRWGSGCEASVGWMSQGCSFWWCLAWGSAVAAETWSTSHTAPTQCHGCWLSTHPERRKGGKASV